MKKAIFLLGLCSLLTGCASTHFAVVAENEYNLYKLSDACAVGSPSSLLDHLRQESVKFCAARKELPIEISSLTEMGIPAIRCTSASLRFKCAIAPEGSKK